MYNCFDDNIDFIFWQIMAFYGEPQWAVVGDTFPVGCAWGNSIVYRQTSFKNNPDGYNSLYKSVYILVLFSSHNSFLN
jgi:hypothetical protein